MTIEEVRQLHPGDEVTWNDPDEGACTKTITIQRIEVQDGAGEDSVVSITDTEGDDLECFARELT